MRGLAEGARRGDAARRPSARPSGAHPTILTFDIGGTYMRAGIYDAATDSLSSVRRRLSPNFLVRPRADDLQRRIMGALAELARRVLEGRRADIVSLAFPAPIDGRGDALAAPTLFGGAASHGFPVAAAGAGCWPDARVVVLNDLTAAGFRYVSRWQDFCILTVGSGIGHKVFLGGRPQVGPAGRGGEIGHLRVDLAEDAPPCDCGGRGHLGGIASGRGAVRVAARMAEDGPAAFRRSLAGQLCGGDPRRIDSAILVEAFRSRDPWTRAVIRYTARRLGQGLAAIHLGVGVEVFIIIGGFATALGEDYRVMLAEGAEAAGWKLGQNWAEMIRFGAPDDNHALIGGGRYAARRWGAAPRQRTAAATAGR